ncbi:RNA-directed DNA polymerase, eukaryota, reverse transcriptase zinc-binding domain protein [Tanacetum coccineum]
MVMHLVVKKGPDIDHFPILEPFGVEFDVFRNEEFRDINDNHVGVDVNSLRSVNATAARYYNDGDGMFRVLRLNSGENYQVWIDYMDFEINTHPGFVTPGCLIGIMLSPSLQLSHLFYADDVIFMGQWNESNLDMIIQVLECFHRASGLRLNMSKGKLMGIYVDADKVTQAARKIGCVTLKTPFTYLGSKVGDHMSRIQSWNETIEAMASRLSKWKMKTLSIGGVFPPSPHLENVIRPVSTLSRRSPSSTRWIKAVPIKVNVLAWKIKLDNLPTRLNISRRGMDIDSILCPTCGKDRGIN